MVAVGAYERISDDAENTGLGVSRQHKDNEKIADLRGWEIARHYTDNDVSAYKRNVRRPEFEQLLSDLREKRVAGVVGYNIDRLFRQPRDLERMIDLYEEDRGLLFATAEGDINLQSSDGRTMARVMVAFANKSSADTGRRTARKHLALAESGVPVGGRRPFGWGSDKSTLNKAEARLVRRAVGEVIEGKSVTRVAREWNEAGIRTTADKDWSPQTLRNYLRSPRLYGVRTYHKEVLLDGDGHPVRGLWEPLLDEETYDRLQLVIGRHGDAPTGRRGARKYLLTGLLGCAVCRGTMYGTNAREEGRFNYACNTSAARDAERHTVSISGASIDKLIGMLAVERLGREVLESEPVQWDGDERLEEIGQQIDSMMGAFLDGRLSESVVFPRVEALEKERVEMQKDRTTWLLETTGPVLQSVSHREWEAMSNEEKRPIIDRLLTRIYVRPSGKGKRFSPERVVPVWRGAQQADSSGPA